MSCLGCGAALTKRHQKVFCSNRCQRAMERKCNVSLWLETGVAHTGSGIGHYVRSYLLEQQESRCALCGCSTTWQGSELRLVLDHVDGDSTNNRRENLRLLCPNCDSQLPTFKAATGGTGGPGGGSATPTGSRTERRPPAHSCRHMDLPTSGRQRE